MAEYKINEFGEIIFDNNNRIDSESLWEEYARLEYEVLNNHHNPTKDPIKIARYNELKKQLDIEKSNRAFDEAIEKIKQEMISYDGSADKSSDNSVLFTAISKFKKTNE